MFFCCLFFVSYSAASDATGELKVAEEFVARRKKKSRKDKGGKKLRAKKLVSELEEISSEGTKFELCVWMWKIKTDSCFVSVHLCHTEDDRGTRDVAEANKPRTREDKAALIEKEQRYVTECLTPVAVSLLDSSWCFCLFVSFGALTRWHTATSVPNSKR